MKHKTISILLVFLSAVFSSLHAAESENGNTNLVIQNAWIAEAPPVSKVMVAYMTLKNTGESAIEVMRAESESYSSIEFHETVHENGMARMIRHSSLMIPANSKLELKRGGPHLMLFNPVNTFKAGDTIKINLTTKDNKSQTITVTVEKPEF
jgi:periplasmic copper chaperone A